MVFSDEKGGSNFQLGMNMELVSWYEEIQAVNVVASVLTKVGKPNRGSRKYKGASRDFRKKAHFKLQEDQIAMNRSSKGTYFMSSEAYKHLFSILTLGCSCIYSYFMLVVSQRVVCPF